MPIYKCPKCGRTVELPSGIYYCKVCGPSTKMRNEELFNKMYEAFEKVVHGETLLYAAPVHELRMELKVSNEELSKMLTELMIEYGSPYIELIKPSITLPRWKPVEVLGRKYWWVKLRRVKE